MVLAPVICITHGGGPLPLLGDESHRDIVQSLKNIVPRILKLGTPEAPRAIIVVTAHWSERKPKISSAKKPKLYFDYYGFPREAYELKYDASGSPEVAQEVMEALENEKLHPVMDDSRGWDHGVFVPLKLINPKANIPIVQLSVLTSEDPDEHFRMGRALFSLRSRNIAIVGSGFASFHNIAAMRSMYFGVGLGPDMKLRHETWNKAITAAVLEEDWEERGKKFAKWRDIPGSFEMQPKGGADHFMPLIVCAGAAGPGKGECFKDNFAGLDQWSYYWA